MAIDERTWQRLLGRPVTEASRRRALAQHLAGGGVLETDGVPLPYTRAIEARRLASGLPAAVPPQLRDEDDVPKPWTSALAKQRAAECR